MGYARDLKEGQHQLRHYFASIMLTDGATIPEPAIILGHHDPAYTLRVYGHMRPGRDERARAISQPACHPSSCGRAATGDPCP